MGADDLTAINLDVYDTREGWWNPDRGEVEIPLGWEFLPRGDAFLTRTVKAAGIYWVAWKPKGRHRPHRRLIGVWAPAATLAAARSQASATESSRLARRQVSARSRDRREDRYRDDLAAAVVAFLDFAPEHAELAIEIARGAAERSAVLGSGRVGRTRTLPLDERAALAARACIRHQHTDYDDTLDELATSGYWDDETLYQEARAQAQTAVDDFLARHRRR